MEEVLHTPVQRSRGNRATTLVACIAAACALAIVVASGLALYSQATVTDFTAKNLSPSLAHPFGTDWMGRDMLSRTLAGLSTSVLVGLLAATVSSVIALVLGCAAALGGKRADAVISWLIDLMMGVPHIVLLVLISYAIGKGFWGVTIGVAVTHWPSLARNAASRSSSKLRASWGKARRASRCTIWCPTCCRSSWWGLFCSFRMPSFMRRQSPSSASACRPSSRQSA